MSGRVLQAAGGISAGQVNAVGILLAEMFNEPNAEKRFSLEEVVQRAAAKRLTIPAAAIDEVRSAGGRFPLGEQGRSEHVQRRSRRSHGLYLIAISIVG